MTDWWGPYLARSFDAQRWTCWHLVRAVLSDRFDVDVPEHGGVYPGTFERVADAVEVERERGGWLPVHPGEELPGDVVVMLIASIPCHVAVVVRPGLVLHVSEGFATRADRIAAISRILPIVGIWRHPALAGRHGDREGPGPA